MRSFKETVLTVVFDVKQPYSCETADFTLVGTGLTDSLTEGILLNFVDDSVFLEYKSLGPSMLLQMVLFCSFF